MSTNVSVQEQQRTHRAVKKAVDNGVLVRPTTCARCGNEADRIEGHHEDYSAPLEVEWLCVSCHVRHHVTTRVPRGSRVSEDGLVAFSFRVHADTLAEFDAMCRSRKVDSDRSKEIRRLMRESVDEFNARENGRAA